MIGNNKRIEYIDALRGFTMILVVMGHTRTICMNANNDFFSFLELFFQFRMPLFFFISGFVFYSAKRVWNWDDFIVFMKKKIPVQIITPALFFISYCVVKQIDISYALLSTNKVGYWFTTTLFEFFLFYIFFFRIIEKISNKTLKIIIWVSIGVVFYVTTAAPVLNRLGIIEHPMVWLFDVVKLNYFLYFILGTLVKQYYTKFCNLLDGRNLVLGCLFLYFGLNVLNNVCVNNLFRFISFFVCSICGLVLIFTLFRKYEGTFTKDKKLGRMLQYIGRHTLDIYLLHYFFLPQNMKEVSLIFSKVELPLFEFFFALGVALMVIVGCLMTSTVYRLSPFVEEKLFGVKKSNL